MHGLGYRRDPVDARDHLLAVPVAGKLVPAPDASCAALLGDPLDQLTLNSCVANAVAKLLLAGQLRAGQDAPDPASRLAIYYLARALNGGTERDAGCYIRSAFKAVAALGFCAESLWPYTDSRAGADRGAAPFQRPPPVEALLRSYDQSGAARRLSYQRIEAEGEERLRRVRLAVGNGMPVAFGTQVTADFVDGRVDSPLRRPGPKATIAGGHAMIVGGYSGEHFVVLNSYGPGWGRGGWCVMHADYLAWGETDDLWVAAEVPPYPTAADVYEAS